MVSDETIRKVRLGILKGTKIKELARLYKISKNTVRKILRSNETSFQYKKRRSQSYPALGKFLEPLKQRLEANKGLDRKRRKTLTVIHEELLALGYQGSYSSVRRFHQVLGMDESKQLNDAYIPLEFDPGEAFQFAWRHEHIKIKGKVVKIKVAHFILSHSSMPFMRAYLRETTEMVLDAHNHAFTFYEGLCEKGIYDNMKTAVSKILKGKDREFNKRFMAMCNHYLFEPVACTPASGWEKGQVERQVATMRPRFFNDIIEVDSLIKQSAH